jgi:hypothetical protein
VHDREAQKTGDSFKEANKNKLKYEWGKQDTISYET